MPSPQPDLQTQVSSLQLLLLSHLTPPTWLPPQYPHSTLLETFNFNRLKISSELWKLLRLHSSSLPSPTQQTHHKRPYTTLELALVQFTTFTKTSIWDRFLPGLPKELDEHLLQLERTFASLPLSPPQSPVGSPINSGPTSKIPPARQWRIMTLGLLLSPSDQSLLVPQAEYITPLAKELLRVMFPGYKPSEGGEDALLKRLVGLMGDIAELAVQLRTQRDEEGEFEVFFPEMGGIGVGCVEVGRSAEEDDDEDEEDGVEGGKGSVVVNGSREGGDGGDEEGERWVVGGLAWPGLKKGGEVVRPAEVLVVGESGAASAGVNGNGLGV